MKQLRILKNIKKLEVKGYSGIYNCHKYWGKKPVELYELIIEQFVKPNGLVCDPFVGSGILPSVCKIKGINFDGCDLNPAAIDVARIFIDPPTKSEVEEVFNFIKKYCEKKINKTYTLKNGVILSHIVWNKSKVDEFWTREKRSPVLVKFIKNLDKKAKFKPKRKLKFFKDRVLFKNSRINVKEGQKVSELFTPRAIENIDLILEAISKLNKKQKRIARFILTSSLGQMSKMVFTIINRNKNNKLDIKKKYEVGSWVIGYWRPKKFFEINVWQVFEGRAIRLKNSVTDSKFENVNIPKSFIKIECEDAVEYLRKMREGSVDLMVTDPPHSDRIPYLELSEMWNTFLGYNSDLKNELIYSNSLKRKKTLDKYLEKFEEVINQIGRVLKCGGIFILIFNTTEKKVWKKIERYIITNKSMLKYQGRFSADYSAGSVVQDNRKGALVNDWCLVISKGEPNIKISPQLLPSWSKNWI